VIASRENKVQAKQELLKGSRLEQVLQAQDKNSFELIGDSLTREEKDFIKASLQEKEIVETREKRDNRGKSEI